MAESVSSAPWSSFGESDYSPQQWFRACLVHLDGASPTAAKATSKLPIREPDGTLNRNGMLAAQAVLAGARGGVQASGDQKRAAAKALARMMGSAQMNPADSVRRMAGMSMRSTSGGN